MGDSYIMRRFTLLSNIPYYTTIKGANAAINSIQIFIYNNLLFNISKHNLIPKHIKVISKDFKWIFNIYIFLYNKFINI